MRACVEKVDVLGWNKSIESGRCKCWAIRDSMDSYILVMTEIRHESARYAEKTLWGWYLSFLLSSFGPASVTL